MKIFSRLAQILDELLTEERAVKFCINLRCKDGAFCLRCKSKKIYTLKNNKSFKCNFIIETTKVGYFPM